MNDFPGTITLPAKRLFEIVRALPDKEIYRAKAIVLTC
jgi:DNA polymerase III sliding clamp (beta) subunit (PCNA family)